MTILCGLCPDPIRLPDTADIDMVADLIAAHGGTHGQDWRDAAREWAQIVTAFSEAER